MTTNTINNLPPIVNRRIARIEAAARSVTPGMLYECDAYGVKIGGVA